MKNISSSTSSRPLKPVAGCDLAGLRVIANIETGQEMIQRWQMDDVFYGFAGNWIMQEAVLASGCVGPGRTGTSSHSTESFGTSS